MKKDLSQFADRLVPVLVDLANLIAVERSGAEENQATAHIVDRAEDWLTLDNNWCKDLNRMILDRLRVHPLLASLDANVDAPTYAEVQKRASERKVRPLQHGVNDLQAGEDASET